MFQQVPTAFVIHIIPCATEENLIRSGIPLLVIDHYFFLEVKAGNWKTLLVKASQWVGSFGIIPLGKKESFLNTIFVSSNPENRSIFQLNIINNLRRTEVNHSNIWAQRKGLKGQIACKGCLEEKHLETHWHVSYS